jgi:hypothetical protein
MDHLHTCSGGQRVGDRLHGRVEIGPTGLDPVHGLINGFVVHRELP